MSRILIALVAIPAMAAALFAAEPPASRGSLPASVDWRPRGVVSPVRDEGLCNSSWAFAATDVLESAIAIRRGNLPVLSVQQLVDCSGSHGNLGCNGGRVDSALDYVHSHGGIALEADYPYRARPQVCLASRIQVAATCSGHHQVAEDDGALLAAVASQPVAVEIHASDFAFQNLGPNAGVYPCIFGAPDHWVTIVGYGTDAASGKDYWLIKNDWGTSWGDGGYARIERAPGCREMSGATYADVP